MGNGLETLAYSPSEMDKLILNVDDNIEWLNKSEFSETRKIINLLKKIVQEKGEKGSIPDKYNGWSNYLIHSLESSLEININKYDSSKNLVEKSLEEKIIQDGLNLDSDDTSLNNGLTWVSNNGKSHKRKNTNKYQ